MCEVGRVFAVWLHTWHWYDIPPCMIYLFWCVHACESESCVRHKEFTLQQCCLSPSSLTSLILHPSLSPSHLFFFSPPLSMESLSPVLKWYLRISVCLDAQHVSLSLSRSQFELDTLSVHFVPHVPDCSYGTVSVCACLEWYICEAFEQIGWLQVILLFS